MATTYGAVYQKMDQHADSAELNWIRNNNDAVNHQKAPKKKTCCWFVRVFLTLTLIGLSTFLVVYLISFRHQILPSPLVNVSSESIITVGANDIWSDIDIKNADGSITRLQLFPTTNLATGLKDDKKWPGDFDVIKNWPWDGVPPGTSSKSEISVNDNWRIDLQGVSPNGPPGSKKTPGVTWANLQIQLGGKGRQSQEEARNRRNKGLSTSVAEIHAAVGVKFSQKAFQRAFSESQSNTRDGGAQVWMSLIQRKQLSSDDDYSFLDIETVTSASSVDDDDSSWTKLQISPNSIGSMPFGDYRINIYEHAANKDPGFSGTKRYYYAPIVLVNQQSAYSSFNNVSKEPEMRFRITMWNEPAELEIVKYVSKLTQQQVNRTQVEIIPFDKVILVSSKSSKDYRLTKDWTPYQLKMELEFALFCYDKIECDALAENMRTSPGQFSHLKLYFSLSAQTTQRRETVIRIQNIVTGEMATKLDQKFRNANDTLLTAADEKRLLVESSTNVLIDSFDDMDVVSPSTETQIYNLLQDLLVSSRTTIKDESDKMWDSVFWNDDNFRPDKTTKTFNEIYSKLDTETQTKMRDEFSNESSKEFSASVSAAILGSLSTSMKEDIKRSGMSERDYLNKLFQECKSTVEWEGEKFTPKSMALSRINLNTLRNDQELHDRSVRVSYSTAVLPVAINIQPYTDQNSTNQLFEIQRQFNDLKNDQAAEKLEIVSLKKELAGANTEIDSLKKELKDANTKIDEVNKGMELNADEISALTKELDASITSDVSFHAYRTKSLHKKGIVDYQETKLNTVGNALDLDSGVFTVPKAGTYLFHFHCTKVSKEFRAYITLNGNHQTAMWTGTDKNPWAVNGAMSAVLNLRVNDKVAVWIDGEIYDQTPFFQFAPASSTAFFGVLLREKH